MTAIIIPTIPITFPLLADSGCDRPFNAKIKKMAEIK
jgi:hypothetical protein